MSPEMRILRSLFTDANTNKVLGQYPIVAYSRLRLYQNIFILEQNQYLNDSNHFMLKDFYLFNIFKILDFEKRRL